MVVAMVVATPSSQSPSLPVPSSQPRTSLGQLVQEPGRRAPCFRRGAPGREANFNLAARLQGWDREV